MTDPWLQAHKLAPPAPPAGFVPRAGLAEAAPVAVLAAGPGYGKTLGLLGLAERARAAGGAVAWYALDPYDADPATFFQHLAASVAREIPGFGPDIQAAIAADRLEPRMLWQRFFQAVAAFNPPSLVLALDDAHHLAEGGEAILQGLAYFFDKLPPRVRVLLATRRKLPIAMSRLVASGAVAVLGPERLRFDAEEEATFLAGRAPDGQVPESWRAAAAGLEGWPLGLALVAGGQGDGGGAAGDPALLADVVAEEFYLAQPPARQAFMVRAALLDDLDPAACEAAAGADAGAHLAGLEADQLVFRLAGGGYRFPAYLADFLRAEAPRAIPQAERAAVHRAAATHFEATGRRDRAVPHLIAAGAWDEAIALARALVPGLVAGGRQAVVERWLAALPQDLADASPDALLWSGLIAARRGRHEEARPRLERARARFAALGDANGELKAIVRLTGLALVHDDATQHDALARDAQALLPAGGAAEVADLHLMRAFAADRRGDMAEMRAANAAVLELPAVDGEVVACRSVALLNLFTWHLHRGDVGAARAAIEETVELATAHGLTPFALFGGFLRAHLDVTTGQLDRAQAFLRGLPAGWQDLLDWHDLACAHVTWGHYHLATADWPAADEALRRGSRIFERAGFAEGEKVARERLVWLAVVRRLPARALELAGPEGEAPGPTFYDAAIALGAARAHHLDGRPADALALLGKLAPRLDELGARLLRARADLYEAAARLATGDAVGAAAARARAEAAIDAEGYEFLREQDQVLWEDLAAAPVADDAPQAAVAAEAATPPAPAPAAPDIADEGEGTLDLRLFGPFEARRGGVVLDQWPRKKARLLLATLALYPRGLDVSELADLWGEEAATTQLVTTMRVNVMALRRILEPDLGKGEASRYVHFENDRYVLDRATVAAADVWAFEAAIAEAERHRRTDPAAAAAAYEAALGLYRGPLLEDAAFGEYFEAERERYRRQALAGAFFLADQRERAKDVEGTDAALDRARAIAPAEEDVYERQMRHFARTGRPDLAKQAYWACRKALQAHLGLPPTPEFDACYQEVMAARR